MQLKIMNKEVVFGVETLGSSWWKEEILGRGQELRSRKLKMDRSGQCCISSEWS